MFFVFFMFFHVFLCFLLILLLGEVFKKSLDYLGPFLFLEKCKKCKNSIDTHRKNMKNQKNIMKFINYCKTFENDKGYLTQSFFKTIITKKAKIGNKAPKSNK